MKKGKISLKILQTSPKKTQFIFEFGGFSQILPKNVLESRQRKVEMTGNIKRNKEIKEENF